MTHTLHGSAHHWSNNTHTITTFQYTLHPTLLAGISMHITLAHNVDKPSQTQQQTLTIYNDGNRWEWINLH